MDVLVPLLGGTEDQKKKRTALGVQPFNTLGGACGWMITNGILCSMDWLDDGILARKRLTPSQVADGRALMRIMLCLSVAAAAAAVAALRQPVGRRLRLDLAHVALAFTTANHCVKICLVFRFVILMAQKSSLLLTSLFAVAVLVFAAVDLLFFMAIHRGDGAEEE
ncbi:unnamed protein product [Urochloa humidicola]